MAARLKERYQKEVAPAVAKEFGIKNPMAIPRVEKVVLNMGMGEAIAQALSQAGAMVTTLWAPSQVVVDRYEVPLAAAIPTGAQLEIGMYDPESGERVTTPITRLWRQYGMCMEMRSAAALKAYDADPYHQIWSVAYSKVRVEGTTTFNILPK